MQLTNFPAIPMTAPQTIINAKGKLQRQDGKTVPATHDRETQQPTKKEPKK